MSKLVSPILIAIVILVLSACSSGQSRENRLDDPNAVPEDNIQLIDSEVFDYKLGLSLARNLPKVTLAVISPFSANQIPERLEKWLSAVDEHGGEVTVVVDPRFNTTKGLISEAIDLVFLAYDAFKKTVLYNTTDDYNATLYYNPNNGNITKVIFLLKEQQTQEPKTLQLD